jgi:pyruvate formate-lyase activating enzyme-like uncharacterized protein
MKEQLKQWVAEIFLRDPRVPFNDNLQKHVMRLIEIGLQDKVTADIRRRQERLERLEVSAHGALAVWGDGELTPGCRSCLFSRAGFQSIRASARCNLDCRFCYYHGMPESFLPAGHYESEGNLFSLDDLKNLVDKRADDVEGIAWVYYEPFLEFEKHLAGISYIAGKGIHQWLYTNGTLTKGDQLERLADGGLTEIRFDLAATSCSRKVLEVMREARKHFRYLAVESPMFADYYRSFLEHKSEILDTGVDHLHCAELHLREKSFAYWADEPVYRYNGGYVSPISSRQLTYDLMDLAEAEGWKDVVIHDCSNAVKYLRNIKTGYPSLKVGTQREIELPPQWYVNTVAEHLEDGVVDGLVEFLDDMRRRHAS